MKVCTKCNEKKLETEFYVNRHKYLQGHCKVCHLRISRETRQKRPEYYNGKAREWARKYPERTRKNHETWWLKLKLEMLNAYGKKCACCEEANIKLLCIDHIHGGGNKERKKEGIKGVKFYGLLRRRGFPKGYQTLCFNCNIGKALYIICPHKS